MNLDNMNLGNSAVVLRSTAVEQNAQFKRISETYSEHAKLVFLFDVSGSMNERITRDKRGESYTDEFIWTPELLADIRAKVAAALAKWNKLNAGTVTPGDDEPEYDPADELTSDEEDMLKMTEFDFLAGARSFAPADDEAVKVGVIQHDLIGLFDVLPNITRKHQEPPTRIGIVKKLAKQELNARFRKFPNSRIAVVPFSGTTVTLFDDGAQSALDAEIDKMGIHMPGQNGGTDILNALRSGLDICRRKPSDVGIHHFIVVTDGEDWNAAKNVCEWVPALRASGVVLDYIHIGDLTPNVGLQEACKALGGEYVNVNTEKDLAEKFQLAVARLYLPPVEAK